MMVRSITTMLSDSLNVSYVRTWAQMSTLNLQIFGNLCAKHFYRPQRCCGKVIFSQACVKNSVHGGCLPQCMLGDTNPPSRPARHPPGQTPTCPVPAGIYMATAADGTHPIGMHSCDTELLSSLMNLLKLL